MIGGADSHLVDRAGASQHGVFIYFFNRIFAGIVSRDWGGLLMV
jgi:hypothetical protein